jgi:hypothetical protein
MTPHPVQQKLVMGNAVKNLQKAILTADRYGGDLSIREAFSRSG